ncbi:MAG: CCA tRNA nucleotidyltransferase [Chloroflexi bacterium]|nr:CCA tRNA nucleotidyltransferase [Chloroflexota bacterium]
MGEGRQMDDGTARPLDAATAARLRAWAAGWPELRQVLERRPEMPVYLVGGSVRDLLLGGLPIDADLVLPGGVGGLARALAAQLRAARVPLHDDPPTERVALRDGRTLDLAAYRGPDLPADLRARDITVNALVLDLAVLLGDGPLAVIDPTGGLADLHRGRVRLTGPGALRADPLRVLRAYRLLATLPPPPAGGRWRLTAGTVASLCRARRSLRRPARERVAAEVLQVLASPRAAGVVRALERDGVLLAALPALARPARAPAGSRAAAARRARQATMGRLGWARRTLPALVEPARAGPLAAVLAEDLAAGRPRAALLGWLALTRATAVAWRLDRPATAALVATVATSLRASRREQTEAAIIARVLGAHDLLTPPTTLTDERDRRGALAALAEAAPGALLLIWALRRDRPTEALRAELDRYWAAIAPLLAAPPLLDGATVMRELDLPAGPAVGRLLAAVHDARLRGEIATTAEALALARALRRAPGDESTA